MEQKYDYFKKASENNNLSKFIQRIIKDFPDIKNLDKLEHLFALMESKSDLFDRYCDFNNSGNYLFKEIDNYSKDNDYAIIQINRIYIFATRYFIELDINGYANDRELTYFYYPARESIYNFNKISEDDYPEEQKLLASKYLPIYIENLLIYKSQILLITRGMYHLNNISADIANYNIKKYESLISKTKNDIENQIKDFNAESKKVKIESESLIQSLNDSLEKAKTYKFIELNQGFDKILQDKKQSLDILITLLIIFGGICTSILCYKINYILTNQINLFEHKTISLFISSFALFFLCLYFFKIALNKYNSVSNLIVQIQLRQALCEFIKPYTEHAKEMCENDKNSLDKFENLIFSNLSADNKEEANQITTDNIIKIIELSKK